MQNVLITGGAGYLGRAYLRWAREHCPEVRFTIYSRDEGKHNRCRREFPQHRYIMGDVRDATGLDLAIAGHDTVIHTAAFKWVPQGETNGIECCTINAQGSLNVGLAAIRHNVDRVIGISTDKACSPLNNYGISKLLMERYFQELNGRSDTQFNLVRYGNVVSSTGSVIPIFRQQLKDQGFVTLTDPDMTRFWITVYEGVTLINLALQEKDGGTVLIPRCPSIRMQTLADIVTDKIKVTGLRFGEKRHESLLNGVEAHFAEDYGPSPSPWSLMRLYPMFKHPAVTIGEPYSSDNPDHVLTAGELQKMIEEAPE